jgi:hypothetical protein
VPFTSFAEHEVLPDGTRPPVWLSLDETRPLAFFAGLWTRWTSVRKLKEREVTADLFGFLTTEPKGVVRAVHPMAMPVILTREDEVKQWLTAPAAKYLSCSGRCRMTRCGWWPGGEAGWRRLAAKRTAEQGGRCYRATAASIGRRPAEVLAADRSQ